MTTNKELGNTVASKHCRLMLGSVKLVIPEKLEESTVYVSIEYATATHLCCCGCGREIVTPISPTGWTLSFDGESLSLNPSIGNWSLRCKSHYWIRNNRVRWARAWSVEEIEAGRAREKQSKDDYFRDRRTGQLDDIVTTTAAAGLLVPRSTLWQKDEAHSLARRSSIVTVGGT